MSAGQRQLVARSVTLTVDGVAVGVARAAEPALSCQHAEQEQWSRCGVCSPVSSDWMSTMFESVGREEQALLEKKDSHSKSLRRHKSLHACQD